MMNMVRRPPEATLEPYRLLLEKWMPAAQLRLETRTPAFVDGVLTWDTPAGPVRYLVEEKTHLRFQDVQVVVDQLARLRQRGGPAYAGDRWLLLAPHVRPQQAAVLERANIDYLDLAGNVHLTAPGLLVHIEGRHPPKNAPPLPGRPQRAWIKAVMALLIRPELAAAPYRLVAEHAGVALGTVAQCMTDLAARGIVLDRKGERVWGDRQALVALWVQAYVDVLRPKLKERRFQIHAETKQEIWTGLDATLTAHAVSWALTGADAAERRHRFFQAEETEIYARVDAMTRDVQKALVAQPVERGGNLLVIEPPGPLAIPVEVEAGPPTAPDLLAYAELRFRGTDQALEAAQLLLPTLLP
jgi:hypothetical protein